jgi:hypothetical protein
MLKAALIIDGNEITEWQRNALDEASDLLQIELVLSCTNTRTKKNILKNFLYYILNVFTLKNRLTRRSLLYRNDLKVIEFASIYEKSWHKIPSEVSEELLSSKIDIVIKFGMSLLRIDEPLSKFKILSYHHGDPSYFRGRPAGFYELLQRKSSVGTIVQEISNKLDAGKVWAISHSKIFHHSYKKTSVNFYTNSRFLLRKALVNLSRNTPIDVSTEGKNYKLPSNFLVLKFILLIALRKIKRIFYGAFYEKQWNVATVKKANLVTSSLLNLENSKVANISEDYNFYADPFFSADGKKIRLEALNSKNGLGEILELNTETLTQEEVLFKGNHYSYPFSFVLNDDEYLIPEVASHSSPYILRAPFDSNNKIMLKGMENLRIVDSTIFEDKGVFYLFCGMNSSASDCLYLFYSEGCDKGFIPHPLNPIVIDPSRARMGGRILRLNEKIYRFGQDNSYGYGDGVSICEITSLSISNYDEKIIGNLKIKGACGPHTIDLFNELSAFDFYVDKFSLLASYRRVLPLIFRRLKKR